jgi:glutaminyl-tRNA synthetase
MKMLRLLKPLFVLIRIIPMTRAENSSSEEKKRDFIREIVAKDVNDGVYEGKVHTRFPPEPNGYLHIGHAKSICLNFGIAREYGAPCNLRFDDTNPCTEETEYVEKIKEDVAWLGFDWGDREYYASDYFEQLYQYAIQLIKQGDAYVDSLSAAEISEYRGDWTTPGRNSPYRDRTVEENLALFERMRGGEFEKGEHVLRAKIDMTHPNQNMRDPVMYRILKKAHHRTGDTWCIYPTYDWTHGLCDSIEGITHSICTLEFENHRPLYDWFLERLGVHHPKQIEFAPLELTNTVLSKRKLAELVREGYVDGWDDPRLPTLQGMRRRGITPEAIREFCDKIGVSKTESTVDMALLEHCLRQDLNKRAERRMGVLRPLKVVIDNYPEDEEEMLEFVNNPEDESAGTRMVPFSRELYIERDDFMENPPKKFYRLAPGREVRLRYAYFIKCTDVVKDDEGNITEIHCTYDPQTKGGDAPDGRTVKATLHWVSARHALNARLRLYERLLLDKETVGKVEDWKDLLNPGSLEINEDAQVEPSLAGAEAGTIYQFERKAYFCVDPNSSCDHLVFNRTVTMRDQWKKIQKRMRQKNQ